MLSVARLPFPTERHTAFHVTGSLGLLWDAPRAAFYRFATVSGATVHIDNFDNGEDLDTDRVVVAMRDAQFLLNVSASGDRSHAARLWGPHPDTFEGSPPSMVQYVEEMLDATLHVRLVRRSDGATLFEGTGLRGGLEIEP